MKTATRPKTFIYLLSLAFVVACCKEKTPTPGLPPLTNEGKNTFGCLVNGEIWIAKTDFSVGGAVSLIGSYDESVGDFVLHATKKITDEDIFEDISIKGESLMGVGIYEMEVAEDYEDGLQDWTQNNYTCAVYLHDTLNKGELLIRYLNGPQLRRRLE